MTERLIFEDLVLEGTDNWNTGRAVSQGKTLIARSDISTWELRVYDEDDLSKVYELLAQPNTDTATFKFFDTLQEDGFWGIDDKGYNFRHFIREADVVAGTLKGGKSYLFEYGFLTASYGRVPATFRWIVIPTASK